ELSRGAGAPMILRPDSSAFVPGAAGRILVKPQPLTLTRPHRELTFWGLQYICFAPDGKTVLGATRWQAVSWHASGLLEAVPSGSRGPHGVFFLVGSGPLLLVRERQKQAEERLVLWDALRREVRATLAVPSPRFPATALSPQGQWLATWDPDGPKARAL